MQEERMPLFLINGFLEAGKTEFIKFTMEQEYFKTEGKTLLIVCEEGEEEYEEEFLKENRTEAVYVDDLSELTPSGAGYYGVERYVESGRTEASGRLGSVPADHNS